MSPHLLLLKPRVTMLIHLADKRYKTMQLWSRDDRLISTALCIEVYRRDTENTSSERGSLLKHWDKAAGSSRRKTLATNSLFIISNISDKIMNNYHCGTLLIRVTINQTPRLINYKIDMTLVSLLSFNKDLPQDIAPKQNNNTITTNLLEAIYFYY